MLCRYGKRNLFIWRNRSGHSCGKVSVHAVCACAGPFIAWKDPWSVIEGSGYQVTQSLFAIAAGSWLGKGLTQGRPNDISSCGK
ncbi:MAG: FtsW/RodA/SpoVE family cell cycle protein [Anaerobutyricum sp.]